VYEAIKRELSLPALANSSDRREILIQFYATISVELDKHSPLSFRISQKYGVIVLDFVDIPQLSIKLSLLALTGGTAS